MYIYTLRRTPRRSLSNNNNILWACFTQPRWMRFVQRRTDGGGGAEQGAPGIIRNTKHTHIQLINI